MRREPMFAAALMAAPIMTAVAVSQASAVAAEAKREPAAMLADGTAVETILLSNAKGVSARILSYGATLQSLSAPDRDGRVSDITLGHDTAAEYATYPNFLGVTVGRYANRIAGAAFTLDGRSYSLTANDSANSLHGGVEGFDKRNWRVTEVKSVPVASVTLALDSPDGDQGYPGAVATTVTYALNDGGDLSILFEARTTKPTVINMTNHALFNLAGANAAQGATDHVLTIPAAAYTPVDAALIPTGVLQPVEGSVFDFRSGRRLDDRLRDGRDPQIVIGRGYDHNFALDKGVTAQPQLAARLVHEGSGRQLDVLTTEPGIQLYTGNFLVGTLTGKGGKVYRMGDGIALEPQKFPDAPNQPAFVSARVDPGKPYRHHMIYRVSIAASTEQQ